MVLIAHWYSENDLEIVGWTVLEDLTEMRTEDDDYPVELNLEEGKKKLARNPSNQNV